MKNYTITVNGNVYNVTVEEGTTAGAAPVVSAAKAAPAPKAAPAAPKAAAPAGAAGSVEVTASVPGKICKIEAERRRSCKSRRYGSCTGSHEDGNPGCSTAGWHSSNHQCSSRRCSRIR